MANIIKKGPSGQPPTQLRGKPIPREINKTSPIIEGEVVGARTKALQILREAEEEAQRILDEANDAAKETHERGFEEGKQEGLVITGLDPDGAAAAAGLREGDVIKQVNGKAVTSGSELKAELAQATDRPALLLIAREGADAFVTLSKPRS